MQETPFIEVRTTKGNLVSFSEHFFFDGVGFVPGSLGKGNHARNLSGAIHGAAKITALRTGRVSIRSVGPKGDGRLVHMAHNTKVVIDGTAYVLSDLAG